jgi:Glycosyl hydrolases family 43
MSLKSLLAAILLLLTPSLLHAAPQLINPGAVWPDANDNHIQAHGGGIIKVGDTYYWYGEERARTLPRNLRAVSCYTSTDLVHWTFKKDVMVMSTSNTPTPAEPTATPITPRPKDLPGNGVVLERPKVYYSPTTKKYILYMHLDSGNYGAAGVGTAISDTPDGNFQYLRFFRPLNHESRDIGQFIDDDGANYLVFEDRPNGFHIAKLSDDCLSVDKDMCLIPMHMEGGALVHYQGLYYAIGSALTGWNPNPNKFATAKSLAGPWSDFKNIAPPNVNTYGSQSTMLLKVVGTKATTIIFMGDIWKPRTQWDSRYLWMPLEIGNGDLHLPQPRPWTLDIQTGESLIDEKAPPMTMPTTPPRNNR